MTTDITKIELSPLELELMKNSEWILTKHSVIEKVSSLFSAQLPEITRMFSVPGASFDEILVTRPKISKGERYQNLPYVILDYPAVFSRQDIFALRTMFLWGNFISVTLHLSGKYKNAFEERIIEKIDYRLQNMYLGTGEDQWQHHFAEENYIQVSAINKRILAEQVIQHPFLKIALRYKLGEAGEMDKAIKKACHILAGLL